MTEPKELSVGEIFLHDEYVIPLYQRNYAWEQAQVTQLIHDIWDYANPNAKGNTHKSTNYYIGSLVVHRREKGNSVIYETIDGQQRLTTLNILLSVLKNDFHSKNDFKGHESKLKFDSRKESSDTLKMLSDYGRAANKAQINTKMEQAYLDVAKELKQLINGEESDLVAFEDYLLHKVKILRVEVPADTDLNHYFEIMNNRGEQLEKHEILKAEFLSHLKDDSESSTAFSMIWDACSDMERYMVLGFKRELRDKLFEANDRTWDYFPESFEKIKEVIEDYNKDKETLQLNRTFLDVVNSSDIHIGEEENDTDGASIRFNSVINFSNFLLHVLRVFTKEDITLDDKRLIKTFEEEIRKAKDKAQFAQDFSYQLLRAKFMFDRYIIKREFTQNEDSWSLKSIRLSGTRKNKTFHYANTFVDEKKNRRVLMLLAMFHVSYPQIIYKHWLSGVLYYLMQDSDNEVDVDDYIEYLEALSDAFYFDRFGEREIEYYDIIFGNKAVTVNDSINESALHKGTDVQNFIFNRLDYLIWRSEVVEQEKRYNIENIDKFEFSFRSSVEHFYPRNPKVGADLEELSCKGEEDRRKLLDSFGNLCLISRNKNSELSNYSPKAKAEHYSKSSTLESLKQQLMIRQKDNWEKTAMLKHQEEMVGLLNDG